MTRNLIQVSIFFLLATQCLNAQYFNERIGFLPGNAEVGWNAIENDSGYIMIGGTVPGLSEIAVVQTDFDGNVMFQKTYGSSTFTYSYYSGKLVINYFFI
ncbi:MAG: hypothetical protein COA97_02425 [Flavobacteriales bacterium]|nr:MAG: hypothetical protein COA97_02425 [Flavobacteriales bacterium]